MFCDNVTVQSDAAFVLLLNWSLYYSVSDLNSDFFACRLFGFGMHSGIGR